MKYFKKLIVPTLVVALCFSCFGCGTSATDKLKDYKNKDTTFSISVGGEWTETSTGNNDHIVLDNKDKTLTILVQKYPKKITSKSNINTLDDFISSYHKTAISKLIASASSKTTENITVNSMLSAKAEEFSATQAGTTAKAYIAYIESETGFYSFTITGTENLYDKNISKLKESITTLKEI